MARQRHAWLLLAAQVAVMAAIMPLVASTDDGGGRLPPYAACGIPGCTECAPAAAGSPAWLGGSCSGGRCVCTRCAVGYVKLNGGAACGCQKGWGSYATVAGTGLPTTRPTCPAASVNVRAQQESNGADFSACRCYRCASFGGGLTSTVQGPIATTSCGAPPLVCSAGFANCNANAGDGCEVNTNTNPSHCGGCGKACSPGANVATAACTSGACAIGACLAGFANCNANAGDGCEVNTNTNTSNCGSCGKACSPGANVARAACTSGACAIGACSANFADCNTNAGDGCEVNIKTNLSNCGRCGKTCSRGANVARAACTKGTCGIGSCSAGFANCNANAGDGCEVNTATNTSNCGTCGKTCSPGANVTAVDCASGACVITACASGFFDTNGVFADGCEDNRNTVGSSCPPGTATCRIAIISEKLAISAPAGCETNIDNNTLNCGGCGLVCSAGDNVDTVQCINGTCSTLACVIGTGDCNGVFADGCEVNTATNTSNCGTCGNVCSPGANVTAVDCASGACVITACASGFFDTNGVFADGCEDNRNTVGSSCPPGTATCRIAIISEKLAISAPAGCETNIDNNTLNCGGCGLVCSAGDNVDTVQCINGTCSTLACVIGTGDCNGVFADGCEVNTATNTSNCGTCGNVCSPGANVTAVDCASGACVITACASGFFDTNGVFADGCEDNRNTVGSSCPPGTATCRIAIISEKLAISAPAGCETNIDNNTLNCGGCGLVCSAGDNVDTVQCINGTCSTLACVIGTGDCNGVFADGCEVNTATNTSNCGTCGNVCSPGANVTAVDCASGACVITACASGFFDTNGVFADGCEDNRNTVGSSCPPGTATCRIAIISEKLAISAPAGCETNIDNNTLNCGGCGLVCSAGDNVDTVQCINGTCSTLACVIGTGDCNGVFADGCEVNVLSDNNNCGACGNNCTALLTSNHNTVNSVSCNGSGACALTCAANFVDCNGSVEDGCEVNGATCEVIAIELVERA